MENRNENIKSRRKNSAISRPEAAARTGSAYNAEPGNVQGRDMSGRNRNVSQRDTSKKTRSSDRDFSTHYYGNEKDLRERDRIARADHYTGSSHKEEEHSFDHDRDYEHDRRSRESDIGREPYEPDRHYHRASYDKDDYQTSSRRNWKQMYNEFFSDFSTLVRKESDLIRTEFGEKATLIKQGAVSITTGSIVAFVGVQAIAATIIIALGYVVSWWLAALITGVGLLLIGMALMATAKKKLSSDSLTPHRSMESFDHMGEMFKEKSNEITRH
ncbi:MAG: phage holin family protein [Bacteriovoracaceae bacterium]|nr:phage holin family protein [Bacteriovoracaceae bacterium]